MSGVDAVKTSPIRIRRVFACAARSLPAAISVLILLGCEGIDNRASGPGLMPGKSSRLTLNGEPMDPVATNDPLDESQYVFGVAAAVIPISAPYGSISRTERLWRYLDEHISLETTVSTLNQNGFRIGRGPIAGWEELRTVLREVTGRSFATTNNVTTPGVPLEITLKEGRPAGRVFFFDAEGRLSGRDYPAGDAILSLNFRLNPDRPGDLVLQGAPQIRTLPHTRFVRTETGLRRVIAPEYHTVGELEFTMKIPKDYYIVIGPGAAVDRETSPGAMFLVAGEHGLKTESVIVIVPQVFATELEGLSHESR